MRYKIWEKGDFFTNGTAGNRTDMDADVVELPEGQVPLGWNFDGTRVYGHVSDLRLEDGEITGEVVMDDEKVDTLKAILRDCRFGGYYKDVEWTDESKTRVASCRLIGVSLVLKSLVPGHEETR